MDVIQRIKDTVQALDPICDTIYTLEADKPLLSQVRGCWRGMNKHFAMIQSEQQIPVHEADLLAVLTERYRKSFHAAIPAAFLLDPAHAIDIGSSNIIPPWGSLHDEDRAAVKNLLRRMAPRGKQNAVVEELVQFIGAGYADKDFARAAMSKGTNEKGQPIQKAVDLRRAVWRSCMEKKYPILSALALRLLSMHATSCMSERNWSVWRFTCRDNRRRLALQKAEKLVFISSIAAMTDGGCAMEELDISALYYAALEEADGTIIQDGEEPIAIGDDYYQQLEDELEA